MPLLSKGLPSLKPISDSNCTVSATEYLQAQGTSRRQKVGLASLAQSVSNTLPHKEVLQGVETFLDQAHNSLQCCWHLGLSPCKPESMC